MHCHAGGLIDHLQADLGFAIDRMASKASGGYTARVDVARRAVQDKEMWGKKKVVIWCFSAREFTTGKSDVPIPAQP